MSNPYKSPGEAGESKNNGKSFAFLTIVTVCCLTMVACVVTMIFVDLFFERDGPRTGANIGAGLMIFVIAINAACMAYVWYRRKRK